MLRLFITYCVIKFGLEEEIQNQLFLKNLMLLSILSIPVRIIGLLFLWLFYKRHHWKMLNVVVGYKLDYQAGKETEQDNIEMAEVENFVTDKNNEDTEQPERLSDGLLFWHRKYKGEWVVHSLREEQELEMIHIECPTPPQGLSNASREHSQSLPNTSPKLPQDLSNASREHSQSLPNLPKVS